MKRYIPPDPRVGILAQTYEACTECFEPLENEYYVIDGWASCFFCAKDLLRQHGAKKKDLEDALEYYKRLQDVKENL